MALQLSRLEKTFAVQAVRTMPRRLVFQRLPNTSESQVNARGKTITTYTDIDASHPIPCIYISQSGRKVIINGQTKSVTLFTFDIPSLNYYLVSGIGTWTRVDFSMKYRVHLLADTDNGFPEQYLQVTGGGDDIGPSIQFPAVRLEELV